MPRPIVEVCCGNEVSASNLPARVQPYVALCSQGLSDTSSGQLCPLPSCISDACLFLPVSNVV
ncbi:hypothetical protein EYF80_033889 [Liparis tanakae]|uniref:Uncharacterized protein n=1 Tax=Liparis tanakae TaxID=230148 RepID=A0A4Z2GRK9_9TELE|nr:hypothetical protein EYF80_033889 [Liparis tanakae]